MNGATNTEALRNQYRAIRNECTQKGLSAAEFDAKARRLAHELADGEDITPAIYVRAAREVMGEQ